MSHTNEKEMEIGGEVYVQRRNGTVHLATIKEIDHKCNRVLVGFWESENLNLRLKNVDMNKVLALNKEIQAKKRPQEPPRWEDQVEEEEEQMEPLNLKICNKIIQNSPKNDALNLMASSSHQNVLIHSTPSKELSGIINTSPPNYVSSVMESRPPANEPEVIQSPQKDMIDLNSVISEGDGDAEIEEIRFTAGSNLEETSPVPEVTLPFYKPKIRSRPLKPPEGHQHPNNDDEKIRLKKAKTRDYLLIGSRYNSNQNPSLDTHIGPRNYENGEQYEIFVLEEMLREEINFSRDMSKTFLRNIKKLEAEVKEKDHLILKLQTRLEAAESRGEDFLLLDTEAFVINSSDEDIQSFN